MLFNSDEYYKRKFQNSNLLKLNKNEDTSSNIKKAKEQIKTDDITNDSTNPTNNDIQNNTYSIKNEKEVINSSNEKRPNSNIKDNNRANNGLNIDNNSNNNYGFQNNKII